MCVGWLDLVGFGEVHAVGKLQSGDLVGPVLHFQVGFHDGNVHGFALGGILAFHADSIKFKVTVMSFNKLVNGGGVHDF